MLKKAQIIWSVFVIVTTAAVVWLVWSHLKTYLFNDRQVVLARNAQRQLFELTIAAQDMESAARGFLLTGRDEFLNKHRNARQQVDARLQAAASSVRGIGLETYFNA